MDIYIIHVTVVEPRALQHAFRHLDMPQTTSAENGSGEVHVAESHVGQVEVMDNLIGEAISRQDGEVHPSILDTGSAACTQQVREARQRIRVVVDDIPPVIMEGLVGGGTGGGLGHDVIPQQRDGKCNRGSGIPACWPKDGGCNPAGTSRRDGDAP